ncbi:MAG: hypothetical protein NVSMB56_17810 [Pyrinomonadaceae bacterium]
MRLAAESQTEIEDFFRAHFDDSSLALPLIKIHSNPLINFLLRLQSIGAITLGAHVFVDSDCFVRDSGGRVLLPSRLAVHEATHVLQFAREGWMRFLDAYLRDYFRELRAQMMDAWRAQTRLEAYLAIAHEREAREMEGNFKQWRETFGATEVRHEL